MRACNPTGSFNRGGATGAALEPGAMTLLAGLTAALLRPYLSTEEAADLLCRQPQTLRKSHALTGTFLGIRPRKVGRRLLWPRAALMALVTGDTTGIESERASVTDPVQG